MNVIGISAHFHDAWCCLLRDGGRMFSDELCRLFGRPPRQAEGGIEPFHCDVARSLQQVLEELLLEKVRYLHARTGAANQQGWPDLIVLHTEAECVAAAGNENLQAGGRIELLAAKTE